LILRVKRNFFRPHFGRGWKEKTSEVLRERSGGLLRRKILIDRIIFLLILSICNKRLSSPAQNFTRE